MRIAITGAKGFLGTQLCSRLGLEHDIVPLDLPEWDLLGPQKDEIEACDAIVHAAAVPDVVGLDPKRTWAVNVDGTRALLDAAPHVKSFVFISSSCVYGDDGAAAEGEREIAPCSLYGASKIAGEALVSAWAAGSGSRWSALRPCAIYGPRYARGHVKDFADRYKRDGRVTAFDNGAQRKMGVHVADVADAVGILLHNGAGPYNIAGELWSWEDTARVMGIYVSPGASERGFLGDAIRTKGIACSRLRRLGWMPRRAVEQGVREALESIGWVWP